MPDLKIYLGNRNYSSWSFRAWFALKHLDVAFEEQVIPLDTPGTREEILRYSPSARVPALHHGDLVVWESLAICEYLAELYPDARLWPEDAVARALARTVASEMHAGFAALRRNMPMNMRATQPGLGMGPGVQEDINRICAIWRTCRERHGAAGPYLFGPVGIADAMYAPVVSRFTTYAVDLDEVAETYRLAMLDDPAYRAWLAAARNEPWIIPDQEL